MYALFGKFDVNIPNHIFTSFPQYRPETEPAEVFETVAQIYLPQLQGKTFHHD